DSGGQLTGWLATFADNATIACRYLVIATGRDPLVPTVFAGLPADQVIHSTRFSAGTANMDAGYPYRIAVIGGGQSAAEMLWAAHQKFPRASLTIIMRTIGLANYAVSRFTNELYFPSFVKEFYAAPADVRENLLAQMYGTNYSGLDARLLDTLYEQAYIERVTGEERIRFATNTDVTAARRIQVRPGHARDRLPQGNADLDRRPGYQAGHRRRDGRPQLPARHAAIGCRVLSAGRQ